VSDEIGQMDGDGEIVDRQCDRRGQSGLLALLLLRLLDRIQTLVDRVLRTREADMAEEEAECKTR